MWSRAVRHTRSFLIIILTATIFLGARAQADELLIPRGEVWRYDDTGVDLGVGWRQPEFDDSSWQYGHASFGYGLLGTAEAELPGQVETVLSFGDDPENKHPCTYFRRSFEMNEALERFSLRVRADDGFVVYLNGVEAARFNMPEVEIWYSTLADSAIDGLAENRWHELRFDSSLLVAGRNVVSVEVHQSDRASDDLVFDFELAVRHTPVVLESPGHGAAENQTDVRMSCSAEDPRGLEQASLLLSSANSMVAMLNVTGRDRLVDATIRAETPDHNEGDGEVLRVDADPHTHVVFGFPDLFGNGVGQLPANIRLISATLTVNSTSGGAPIKLYRLTESWIESEVTWRSRQANVPWSHAGADGPDSYAGAMSVAQCQSVGAVALDVTGIVSQWLRGAPNHGILMAATGTDGFIFDSSETAFSPILTVTYGPGWEAVQNVELAGVEDIANFEVELENSSDYHWSCQTTNRLGLQSRSADVFNLSVDTAFPDEPTGLAPIDGAVEVSTSPRLAVTPSGPLEAPLDVAFWGRPVADGVLTVAVLPDTQFYSESYSSIFATQTQWIVDHADSESIGFVSHEGDMVQHWDAISEWEAADRSMSLLDGEVPYGIAAGNHDQKWGVPGDFPYFNDYFPHTRYEAEPWYGGHAGTTNDNNYQLVSVGPVDLLFVHLAFAPDETAIEWADSILDAYPDRIAIIVTHGYLDMAGQYSAGSEWVDTSIIWKALAFPNDNVHMILCGHVHGENMRVDTVGDRTVYQLLADYQSLAPNGGNGYLRLMRFVPSENRVDVETYSPWWHHYQTDSNSNLALDVPLNEFRELGVVEDVPNGEAAAIDWRGLAQRAEYEWYAVVTDGLENERVGPVWRFTTGPDASSDASPDAGLDADVDTPSDAGRDVLPDAASDVDDLTADLLSDAVFDGTTDADEGGSSDGPPTKGESSSADNGCGCSATLASSRFGLFGWSSLAVLFIALGSRRRVRRVKLDV